MLPSTKTALSFIGYDSEPFVHLSTCRLRSNFSGVFWKQASVSGSFAGQRHE